MAPRRRRDDSGVDNPVCDRVQSHIRISNSASNCVHSPLDLTKVRMQATGDKGMISSLKKTVRTAGYRGLFDGITGTWLRQMSYSLCRFWAYDESKKIVGAGEPLSLASRACRR